MFFLFSKFRVYLLHQSTPTYTICPPYPPANSIDYSVKNYRKSDTGVAEDTVHECMSDNAHETIDE